MIREIEHDLLALVERRFGELTGRLDAIAPDARARPAKEFKFASEGSAEPLDLPNPIAPRRRLDS
jgi:hypothetical protein